MLRNMQVVMSFNRLTATDEPARWQRDATTLTDDVADEPARRSTVLSD